MNGDAHPSSPAKTHEDIVNGSAVHEETSFSSSEVRRPRTNSSPGHRHQLSASLSANGPSQSFHYPNPPPSAGPHRTGFHTSQAPPPSSPFNSNFQFGRPPPSASSPMNHSFSTPTTTTTVLGHDDSSPYSNPSSPISPQNHIGKQQRHARIHSRNLSLYFPRPGTAGAEPSIAEDGSQEVEAPVMTMMPAASNGSAHSHTSNGSKRLGEGFTFGRPGTGGSPISPGAGGPSTRKGHHHKHSLSHNFFSFLDPTAMPGPASSTPAAANTSFPSASSPHSPWAPISPFTATSPSHLQPAAIITSSTGSLPSPSTQASSSMLSSLFALPTGIQHALLFAIAEFALGASVWAVGQHNGTIGCAGLGYWVVFDAVGVGLTVYSRMLRFGERTSIQKPYGSQRTETVSLFAQSIYLLFSAVYVCKETVEHVLLSAGSGHHGHQHHADGQGQRVSGIAYPTILIWLSAILLLTSRILYKTHSKLVDATGNYIPSLSSILHPPGHSSSRFVQPHLLSNPFTSAPLLFCFVLLFISYVVSPGQHRYADLVLSGIETLVTFSVAYPAVVTLAQVLCQTAPERGLPGAQMEAFLRVMRELERHPHVLHLPAPHLWQLTPPSQSTFPARKEREEGELNSSSLVATVELHVRKDLPDGDVLQLTRWAWERCSSALGQGAEAVTIGIIRG